MPWQGHLFIGERVSTNADVRAIFTKLGYTGDLSDEEINDKSPSVSKTVELKGVVYPVSITFSLDCSSTSLVDLAFVTSNSTERVKWLWSHETSLRVQLRRALMEWRLEYERKASA
jgi:hypothetical protein